MNMGNDKIEKGIVKCLEGGFRNNNLVYNYLLKREEIIEKAKRKIKKANEKNLVNFSQI